MSFFSGMYTDLGAARIKVLLATFVAINLSKNYYVNYINRLASLKGDSFQICGQLKGGPEGLIECFRLWTWPESLIFMYLSEAPARLKDQHH